MEVPELLQADFANLLPLFKNTLVSKNVMVELMKNYTEGEGLMFQLRKMLISSFMLQNSF